MKKSLLSLLFLAVSLQAQEVYATFTVEAKQSAQLAFTSSGIVGDVLVDVGSEVKKDDVLASLISDDVNASYQIALIALKYAKKEYDRQLQVKQMIDEASLDRYANGYESAKAQAALQKALLDKTILKAPFEGVVYAKDVEVGDAVNGMMLKTVFRLQSLHERKLLLTFDQKYHASVKAGERFVYKVDGDEREYKGTIAKVYPSVDATSRKMSAEVEAESFPVGLFGDGYIVTK